MLVLALAANYDQLSQLLRPVAVATFSGEINGAAFELNGTIQVSHFRLPSCLFIQLTDLEQHGRAQLKKLHPEVNFGKRETDAKVLGTRNKVSMSLGLNACSNFNTRMVLPVSTMSMVPCKVLLETLSKLAAACLTPLV
jgi:hypothetical protein